MQAKRMLPTLMLAAALSAVIAVLAAARHSELTFAMAALLFALQVLLWLLRINLPLWRSGASPSEPAWAWDNSVLTAVTYAWGAAVMLTVYPLGGLVWQHWWQYGLGMALLGGVTLLVAQRLVGGSPSQRDGKGLTTLMVMTMGLVAAIVGALIYLVGSGKLATPKDDWAANVVFLTGGVTILLISVVSLVTYRRVGTA